MEFRKQFPVQFQIAHFPTQLQNSPNQQRKIPI